ncbi:MAG: prolipoprotein diacylglyceryl transferase [Ignavibacteriales bacterium]|nr:prolipoprotein diacylglyceryl transferase [Ignavibacteriales bacterium]
MRLALQWEPCSPPIEAKRRDTDPEIIYDLFLPLAIWGTLGARLWHILTPSLSSLELGLTTQYYLSHPIDLVAFWTGGFGIPGAWLGGTLALLYFARKNEYPFWELADVLAPDLPLPRRSGAWETTSTRNCTACRRPSLENFH